MVTKELQDYVDAQRAAGQPVEELRRALIGSGWPEDQVSEALQGDEPPAAPLGGVPGTAPQMQKVVKVRSKRLIFLVVGIIVVLLAIGGVVAYFVLQKLSAPTFG